MGARAPAHFPRPAAESIEGLHPAYFALVMATGIVAIAAALLALPLIPWLLFWISLLAFAALWLLTLVRLAWYPQRLLADLIDHGRGPAFFTTVAATCVVGNELVVIAGEYRIATALWLVGIALWLGLTYTIFAALTLKEPKPALPAGINGGWLTAVVATQAVSSLGGLVAPRLGGYESPALFLTLSLWLWGGMLYIWMIALIFYRYTFFPLSPADLTPPYWINMGAMAISTLAGTILIANAGSAPFLQAMLPFLHGFTLLFWATATWWIPMLVILGAWRHLVRRFPLVYDPLYWGGVFPLGMYTAATYRLAAAEAVPMLATIAQGFVFVALLAWLVAFAGLLRRLAALVRAVAAGR